jgi:hypothetical protein
MRKIEFGCDRLCSDTLGSTGDPNSRSLSGPFHENVVIRVFLFPRQREPPEKWLFKVSCGSLMSRR